MIARTQRLVSSIAVVSILGLAVSPVIASAATGNTTINANIGSTISVTTSSTVSINLTPTPSGVVSSSSDNVSVSTNDALGYTLTLADNDATTNLVNGGNNIAAHSGTQSSPTALATNSWGYAVAGLGGFDGSYSAENNNTSSTSTWAGVPATGSPNTLKTTSTTAAGDVTTVWYGVNATSAKPNGTYSDTVTYTATAN